MLSKIPITILILGIITTGAFVALDLGDVVEVQDIAQLEFQKEDIQIKRENILITTSSDEFGNVIKTGWKIPIRYNYPVATNTATGIKYIIQEKEEFVGQNFDGFNMCRQKGKTKSQCLKELRDDIGVTLEAKQENIIRELEELKRQAFQEEIGIEDF